MDFNLLTRANARVVYGLIAGSGLGLAMLPVGAPHPSSVATPVRPAAVIPAASPIPLAAPRPAQDLDCLTKAIYYEARGESARGQAAVAQVVLNRVKNPSFPKSVCAVVFQGVSRSQCQFSFACDGAMRQARDDDAWDRARHIAQRALDGAVVAEVGAATNFRAAGVDHRWGSGFIRVTQVGLHVFYRLGRPKAEPAYPAAAPHEPVERKPALALTQVSTAADPAAPPPPAPRPVASLEAPVQAAT